jgi:undecaprenyl-diphosphatase
MWNLIQTWDNSLFLLINHLPHSSVSDAFFAFFSLLGDWRIVWIFMFIGIFVYRIVWDKVEWVALPVATFTTIVFVSLFLKNIFARPRPEFVIPQTIVTWDMTETYSFPSFHAAISCAVAYIFAKRYPRRKWIFWFAAFLISFSRIYLGKHYPSDVAIGALIGLGIGYSSLHFATHVIVPFHRKHFHKPKK